MAHEKRPVGAKPVKRIELSEKHIKLRAILVIALIALALAAFGFAISSLLTVESGWKTVEFIGIDPNCSADFIFNYDLGAGGASATAEYREISAFYSELAKKAHLLFNSREISSEPYNVAYINAHINETVQIDPVLYAALQKLAQNGGRYLYLAPVFAEYEAMFFGLNGSVHTEGYDPYTDGETAARFADICAFLNSAEHIELKFFSDNKVELYLSDEYAAYAKENEISRFIGFTWLKNAFIIDYFADSLTARGYTSGTLTSYDGFTRNLDVRGENYRFNLFDRNGGTVYLAGSMNYDKPLSIVYFRDYKIGESDSAHYYQKTDGSFITPYIRESDGLYLNSVNNIVSYSSTLSCADVALEMMSIYISESFDTLRVNALREKDIYSVWGEDLSLYFNDPALRIDSVYQKDDAHYTVKFIN